jgi:G:T-mismatch repair DNA endonuclease (very short patch repair protein)
MAVSGTDVLITGIFPPIIVDWWQNKIDQNRSRDRDTDEKLRNTECLVLRYWVHDSTERIVSEFHKVIGMQENHRGNYGKNSG